MSDPPRELVDALDMVTAPKLKAVTAQPEMLATHHVRVRRAFDDPNIVAIGISEKMTMRKPVGGLSLAFYVKKKRVPSRVPPKYAIPH